MGRKRKGPWLRGQNRSWYTTVGCRNIRLGSADDSWETIERRYAAELSKTDRDTDWTVGGLIDEFLDYSATWHSAATHDLYKTRLTEFRAVVGEVLVAGGLRPRDVSRWVEKRFGNCSPSTPNGAIRCVVRLCDWAVKERLIGHSPLVGIEEPTPTTRKSVISPEQFKVAARSAARR
jgi:hypothetical protein